MLTRADARTAGGERAILIAFAVVAAVKLALLGLYGPIFTPDSPGYVDYATRMLSSSDWLHRADLTSGPNPLLAARTIGYPALIALARMLTGTAWSYWLVAGQIALSLGAGWAVYRLGARLGLSIFLAAGAAIAYQLSVQMILDLCVLTDSVNASVTILAVCAILRWDATDARFGAGNALAAGLLLVLAFLLRDAMQFLVLALVPAVALRVWLAGRSEWVRSALSCVLVFAPLMVAVQAYKAWNFHRTGERFVTTISTLTVVDALAKAAAYDPAVFTGDDDFARTARQVFTTPSYDKVLTFNVAMFAAGHTSTDVSRQAYARYFELWRTRPRTMFHILRDSVSERVAKLSFRPFGALCDLTEWAGGARRCADYRDLVHGLRSGWMQIGWGGLGQFLARTVEQTVSIGLFLGFLFGIPIDVGVQLARKGAFIRPNALAMGTLWLMYLMWLVAYGIVHLEDRYLMPVIPFVNVGGCYAWRELTLRAASKRQPATASGRVDWTAAD